MGFIYLFVAGLKVKGAIAASVHIPIVAELLCVTFCPWVGVVW
jgi:hypothetical protein